MEGTRRSAAARLLAGLVALPLLAVAVSVTGNTWSGNDSGVLVYAVVAWWPGWFGVLAASLALDARPQTLPHRGAVTSAVCCLGFGAAVVVAAFGTAARAGGWGADRPPIALAELGVGLALLVVGLVVAGRLAASARTRPVTT